MAISIKIKTRITSKILSVISLFFFAVVGVFCIFYIFSGYERLVNWYIGLHDCFYRRQDWQTMYFSPSVKAAGNYYCMAGLALSLAGLTYSIFRWRRPRQQEASPVLNLTTRDLLAMGIAILAALVAWVWGHGLVRASNDEVFSALNCAGIHPLQVASYYMLPNNHILFNLLNNVLFHPCSDKVATGRIISLACYLSLMPIVFVWLRSVVQKRWVALFAVIALAVQLPVWGFGFQARGYAMVTLAGWVTFVGLYYYFIREQKWWLYILTAASVVGYYTIPTFLYFHAAILVSGAVYQALSRRLDWSFWWSQVVVGGVVFLLYLPCVSFSGLAAITGNQYVAQGNDYSQLWGDAIPMINDYMDYCFSGVIGNSHIVDYFLFLLPLLLFVFYKNKVAVFIGIFYSIMWGVCLVLTLKMKLFPIDRALAVQFSVTLSAVIYTLWLITLSVTQRIKQGAPYQIMLILLLVGLTYNYLKKDREFVTHYLCHFTVNSWYDMLLDGLKTVPKNSSVSCSDESYYWKYLCKINGYRVEECVTGSSDYWIKADFEAMSPLMRDNYLPVDTTAFFIIYKRK